MSNILKASGKEESIIVNNQCIKYMYKKAKYDTHSLIVVFSGFGGKSQFTYDFKSSLVSNRSHVLWIKDDFFNNGHSTYYLDPIRDGKSSGKLELAIISFINSVLDQLQLSKDQCTLLGCSKGASSALYYGIKYDFKNLVLSAPVFLIGSSVSGKIPLLRPKPNATFLLEHIDNSSNINFLDRYIIDALEKDNFIDRNIYLFVSKVDPRYNEQEKPFLHYFIKYTNFNYIESLSPLVRTHQDVTSHNTPLILSILGCLSFNFPPNFRYSFIGEETNINVSYKNEIVFDLRELYFKNGKLFIAGIYFFRGIECKNYTDLDYKLLLESDEKESYVIPLAKGNRPSISKEFYDKTFINYDKAFFCTTGHKGLDISFIEIGTYKVSVLLTMKSGEKDTKVLPFNPSIKPTEMCVDNKFFNTKNKNSVYYLEVC